MARILLIHCIALIAVLQCMVTLVSANFTLPHSHGTEFVGIQLDSGNSSNFSSPLIRGTKSAGIQLIHGNNSSCSKFSCEGSCWTHVHIDEKRCSCNEICLEWNNCCSDFLTVCKGIPKPNITDYFLQDMDKTAAFFLLFGTCNYYHGPRYTNVGKCPDTAPQYLRDACHDLSTHMPPVRHKKGSLLNFANIHCALCHGYNISDLIVWEFDFLCDTKYTGDVQTITDSCTKTFYGIKKIEQLMCYPLWNRTELMKPDSKSLCAQYIRPIVLNRVIYKNIYCANLTELTNSSASSTSECLDVDHQFIFENNIRVLFDFKRNSVRIRETYPFSLCKSSQIYDPFFMICRDIICPQDQFAHLGQCYRNQTIFIDANDQPFPFLNQSTKVKFSYHFVLGNLARSFFGHEGMTLLNKSEEMPDPNTPLLCRINHHRTTNPFKTFNVVAEILFTPPDDNLDILISSLAQDRCFSRITLSNIDSHVYSDVCPNSYLKRYSKVHTEIIGFQRYAVVEKDQQKVLYPFHNIGYKISMSEYLSTGLVDEIYVCVTHKAKHNLTCPIVTFKTGEYILRNDSIEITKGGQIIPKDQFVLIGDDAHVCSFYGEFKLNFFDYNQTQQLVSVIVTCISTLCLSMVLFIYIRYKEMRTLGGKLNAFLCFWLLLSQGILPVNSEVKEICKILAAVCHFAWLSAFSTMTAIAVNMAITFHKTKLLDENEQEVRYKRLLSASFIVPSAIVAVCAGLDFGNEEERWRVGYGKGVCTWMSNSIGILVAFYVPICMSLSVNIVSFIITLSGIERNSISSTGTDVENHRPHRQRCLIYTKLSFIMGLTWIFGIVGAVVQNEILWYVFIIFNGLQGFFIFLSFICNRRTWNIIGCGIDRSSVYASSQSNKNTNPNKDVSA